MNGSRYLLDTNSIIQLLKGNHELIAMVSHAEFLAVSIIAELEYYSFPDLSEHDVLLYRAFKSRVTVFDVPANDPVFTRMAIEGRRSFNLKLPDAIIAATARANDLALLTADEHFKTLKSPWQARFYTPC